MKTYIIRDATAGSITYRIEQLVNAGNTIINVIMVKEDAIIFYNGL